MSLDALRAKRALASALAALERDPDAESSQRLLDEAWRHPKAHVVGVTGPPGVGKSSLCAALVAAWRKEGRTVGVIAVDPSSKTSGGALLGDRVRIVHDTADDGSFVRSMAARDRWLRTSACRQTDCTRQHSKACVSKARSTCCPKKKSRS